MRDQTVSQETAYLRNELRFQNMPQKIRSWILESPNATLDFADFFHKGGMIEPRDDIKLPLYMPRDPPKILVKKSDWYYAKQPNSDYIQLEMFGTLAHEIGHDRYNTASVLFRGGSAEDYVRYRSELEAHAIFNAFPIFRDLQDDPIFKQDFPFDTIGYVNGILLGQYYKEWCAGQLDETTAVARIADGVPNKIYDLPTPLMDQNGDDVVTHRDLYLRDYKELILRQPQMAVPQSSLSEKIPRSLSTTETDPAHARLAELQREMDALPIAAAEQASIKASNPQFEVATTSLEPDLFDRVFEALINKDDDALRAARIDYFQSPDGQQLLQEGRELRQTMERKADALALSQGRSLPTGYSIGTLTGKQDPRDWDHPDHALYSAIRRELPREVSDDMAAHVMLQARQAGIHNADRLEHVFVQNNQAFLGGRNFSGMAHVDLSQTPPPMEDTVQQSQRLDQQLALERQQWLAQQQEQARSGPSMSL